MSNSIESIYTEVTDSAEISGTTSAQCSQTDNQPSSHSSSASEGYSETYFDELYNGNIDPWHYQTRWYEKRKRDICLALLPQAHYSNAIELGCGNGVFSELLANRCQNLVSVDGNNQAVQLAKQRLASKPQVKVVQAIIPDALLTFKPLFAKDSLLLDNELLDNELITQPTFDLIVISEILYYLSAVDIDKVITWIGQSLSSNGTLLCCHWRYPIDGFVMTGETVHQRLHQAFSPVNAAKNLNSQLKAFSHQSQIVDKDFLLDVWLNSTDSIARQENLV